MSLTALTRRTADQQVADVLRDHIVRGELAQGTRLTEVALAEQFSISRSSIRTALQHLAQEGLVELTQYVGWAVAALSVVDVWELCTLRASMEGMAARLASDRADEGGRERLKHAYAGLVAAAKTNDEHLIAEADFALHKTIVALSGHKRLIQQYSLVEAQVRMYIASSDRISGNAARVVLTHHQPIVDAIVRGDTELAGRLSEEHNHSEGRILMDYLDAHTTQDARHSP